jgi:hypothetical protein
LSEPALTGLYLARWPDGAATVLSAQSLEHAVDRIDERYDPTHGPLVLLCHRPTLEIDSQREIVASATRCCRS